MKLITEVQVVATEYDKSKLASDADAKKACFPILAPLF